MDTAIQERINLLTQIEEVFTAMGFETNIDPPKPDVPFHSLIVRFYGVGGLDHLDFQLAFLPNALNAPEAENPLILQTFVELHTEINRAKIGDLLWLTAKLNIVLPVGLFGLFDDTRVLYYKYNTFLDKRTPLSITLETIDKQGGVILHIFNLFLEPLLQVAQGELSAQEAFETMGFE